MFSRATTLTLAQHLNPKHVSVRMRIATLLVLGTTLAACTIAPPPFPLTVEVQEILAGWQQAGVKCDDPRLGQPGPALQWSCRTRMADVDLSIGMIADRLGLQSITAGAPGAVPRANAVGAWTALIRATRFEPAFRDGAVAQIQAGGGVDGMFDITNPGGVTGHITIDVAGDEVVLYLVPDNSHP